MTVCAEHGDSPTFISLVLYQRSLSCTLIGSLTVSVLHTHWISNDLSPAHSLDLSPAHLPRPLLSTDMTCCVHNYLCVPTFLLSCADHSLPAWPISCRDLLSPLLCTNETSLLYRSPQSFSLYHRDLSCIISPILFSLPTRPLLYRSPQSFSFYVTSLVCISFCTNTTFVLCRSFCHRYHSSMRVPLYQHVHASHTVSHSLLLCSQDPPSPPRADPSTNMTTHPFYLQYHSRAHPPSILRRFTQVRSVAVSLFFASDGWAFPSWRIW